MNPLTTTATLPPANTRDWAERSAKSDTDALAQARARELARIDAQKAREWDIKRLGGVRAYEDFTAQNFADKTLLRAMAGFPQANYFLWGSAGVGKTHLAVAVARKEPQAYLLRMARISRWLRSLDDPLQESQIISQLAQMTLIIDDLGAEKMTEFLQNRLFEVLDKRWQNKSGGLIITCNMSLDKVSAVAGDRVASRIVGLVGKKNILHVCGEDRRLV